MLMQNKLLDDCFAHDKKRLRHDVALAILKERVRPVVGIERVTLAEAAGRILAAAVVATAPVTLLVLAFQRRIVQGLTAGAVKG